MTTPLASIGIDIGKEVFHIVGFSTDGKIAFRRKIKRLALIETFKKLPPSIVGMEACLSAHFVSRALRQLGHEPRIIPAIYVKPFVKGQKNDYNDAEAIAEASLRPNLRTVREKTQDQLDLQAYHRVRSRLVSRRTATINQIRAFLIEQGIAVKTGSWALRNSLLAILKNRQDEISPRMGGLIAGLSEDWICLDERIETIASEIEKISEKEANCQRLMSVPGIGPLISTAVVAAIGTSEAFERGRDFGAWLGLVPRQYSTGGRSILGRISKRGSKYLRSLFIQAAKRHPDAPAQLGALQLWNVASESSTTSSPQQAGNGPGQQIGPDCMEHPAQRKDLRHQPSRGHGDLSQDLIQVRD
jgi:transposase